VIITLPSSIELYYNFKRVLLSGHDLANASLDFYLTDSTYTPAPAIDRQLLNIPSASIVSANGAENKRASKQIANWGNSVRLLVENVVFTSRVEGFAARRFVAVLDSNYLVATGLIDPSNKDVEVRDGATLTLAFQDKVFLELQ